MITGIISKRIALLRKEKGISQAELAKVLGIQKSSMSYFENGTRIPKIETIVDICNYFNVSTDYLLGLQEERHNEDIQSTRDLGLSEKSISALERYNAYRIDDLESIINLLLEELYDSYINLEYEYLDGQRYEIKRATVLDALSNYYRVNLSPDKDEYLEIRESGLIGTDDYLPGGKYNPELGDSWDEFMTVDGISKNELIEKVLMEKVQEKIRELRKKVEQSKTVDLNGNDTEEE